jgi:hypothetical protein
VTTARTVIWRLIVKVVPSAMGLKSQSQGSQPMVLRSTGRTEPLVPSAAAIPSAIGLSARQQPCARPGQTAPAVGLQAGAPLVDLAASAALGAENYCQPPGC